METELRELKADLDRVPRRGRRGRRSFPAELRKRVLRAVENAVAAGHSVARTGEALGLSQTTLSSWRTAQRTGEVPSATRRLRAVEVRGAKPKAKSPASSKSRPVLVTPRGYRVEGLTGDELCRLLKALA